MTTQLEPTRRTKREIIQALKERGMTTVEYAVGILAAGALALTLLRIINDNAFFQMLWKWVVGLIKNIPI